MQVMRAEARFISDWDNAYSAALFTVGKTADSDTHPSEEWKKKMCAAEHSPLREVVYRVTVYDMPRRAMTHLVRHNVGIEKYVETSRPDRNPDAQQEVVDVAFTINAQSLINISKVRLCNKAWYETIVAWRFILNAVAKIDPITTSFCVPSCIYRGVCPENKPCGYTRTEDYDTKRHRYLTNFM